MLYAVPLDVQIKNEIACLLRNKKVRMMTLVKNIGWMIIVTIIRSSIGA